MFYFFGTFLRLLPINKFPANDCEERTIFFITFWLDCWLHWVESGFSVRMKLLSCFHPVCRALLWSHTTKNIRLYKSNGIIHYNVLSIHFTVFSSSSFYSFTQSRIGPSLSPRIQTASCDVYDVRIKYYMHWTYKKLTNDDWTIFFYKSECEKIMVFQVKWAWFHSSRPHFPLTLSIHSRRHDPDYYWNEIKNRIK